MGTLHLLAEASDHRGHQQPLHTRREVAKHFKVAPRTITRWMARGMPFVRPYENGSLRFNLAECESWARRHR